jgi:hypothetical protein
MSVSSLNPQKKYGQFESLTEVNPKGCLVRTCRTRQGPTIFDMADIKNPKGPIKHLWGAKVGMPDATSWHTDNLEHGHTLETQCHRGRHHRA